MLDGAMLRNRRHGDGKDLKFLRGSTIFAAGSRVADWISALSILD
jgi:hypothetical protein